MRRESEFNIYTGEKQGLESKETKEEKIISPELLEEIPDELKGEAEDFANEANELTVKKPNKIKHIVKTAALMALLAVGAGEGVKSIVDYTKAEQKVSDDENKLQKSIEENDGMAEIHLEDIFSSIPSDMPHMMDAYRVAVDYLNYVVKEGGMDKQGAVETGTIDYLNKLGAKKFGADRWVRIDTTDIKS